MDRYDFTGPHRFTLSAWISCAPFEKLLAMEIVEADAGRAILKMPFYHNFAQGAGLMHGGALVSLADTAVVMAIKSVLPPETHFATISLESRFHHPVKKGILLARAAVVERQASILKGSCDVFDEADRSVMTFTSVFKIAQDASIRGIRFDGATVQPDPPGA
ncbi:MAG TPA: PaaI family thioesterase [Desulfosarcina sp.]|nr:PaaI family thioesterase [Desulfosarcina sp.]